MFKVTARKAAILRQARYHVIEKWECEFKEEKKMDPQLKAFLSELEMVPPLEPWVPFMVDEREPFIYIVKSKTLTSLNILT